MFGFGVLQEIWQQLVWTTPQDVVCFLGFTSGARKTDAGILACAAGMFCVNLAKIFSNPSSPAMFTAFPGTRLQDLSETTWKGGATY